MSLALKITRNPCCRQVLLPRSSTLCKITRRNLATSHNPQLPGHSHHHASLPALTPRPKSDVLMYSAFAAAVVGIPCAILYSVREPYSLSWTQLVTNYGVVLVEFVLPSTLWYITLTHRQYAVRRGKQQIVIQFSEERPGAGQQEVVRERLFAVIETGYLIPTEVERE
jgi:hypothetical protein